LPQSVALASYHRESNDADALDPLPLGGQGLAMSTGTLERPKGSLVRKTVFVISTIVLVTASSMALTQVTIDVSKITCDQFVEYKIADPERIAIWISGYNHGKRNDPILDQQKMLRTMNSVEEYCFKHPQVLVMKAVDEILGAQ
jgi:acid stress chaperone HdeB